MFRKILQEGIQNLSNQLGKAKWLPRSLDPERARRFRQAIAGAAFISLAGCLAWGAQDLVRSNALDWWERKRAPNELTWKHALESHGFKSRTTERAPVPSLESDGHAWIDREQGWIATPGRSLYCRHCDRHPSPHWEDLGLGWTAFDSALAFAEKQPGFTKKMSEFHDPRQIQY